MEQKFPVDDLTKTEFYLRKRPKVVGFQFYKTGRTAVSFNGRHIETV